MFRIRIPFAVFRRCTALQKMRSIIASQIVEREINAVTDNPTIFPDEDDVVSAGNFHGQPLAITMDFLAIALAELGSISERRVYKLISGTRGLPAFLVANPGLNSGFMIPQYTCSVYRKSKQTTLHACICRYN
jgi:histidine ammonia-lyase